MSSARHTSDLESFAADDIASEDTLALSFLDVLSCGLGGAICLFLIFSVMPHVGHTGAGESIQTKVTGQDARAQTVGAKFDDWEDVVYNAPIQIIVSLKYKTEPFPNPPPSISSEQIELRGLPRSAEKAIPRGLKSPKCEWHVYLNDGLRPPSQVISGFIRDAAKFKDYECVVEISVGGSRRQTQTIALNGVGDGEPKLFDLKFTEATWIEPTVSQQH